MQLLKVQNPFVNRKTNNKLTTLDNFVLSNIYACNPFPKPVGLRH